MGVRGGQSPTPDDPTGGSVDVASCVTRAQPRSWAAVDSRVISFITVRKVSVEEADDELWDYAYYVSRKGDPKTNGLGHRETWEGGKHEVLVPTAPVRNIKRSEECLGPHQQTFLDTSNQTTFLHTHISSGPQRFVWRAVFIFSGLPSFRQTCLAAWNWARGQAYRGTQGYLQRRWQGRHCRGPGGEDV